MSNFSNALDQVDVQNEIDAPSQLDSEDVERPYVYFGEALDDAWAAEFDRRLAAWEAEIDSPVPNDVGTNSSMMLPR